MDVYFLYLAIDKVKTIGILDNWKFCWKNEIETMGSPCVLLYANKFWS